MLRANIFFISIWSNKDKDIEKRMETMTHRQWMCIIYNSFPEFKLFLWILSHIGLAIFYALFWYSKWVNKCILFVYAYRVNISVMYTSYTPENNAGLKRKRVQMSLIQDCSYLSRWRTLIFFRLLPLIHLIVHSILHSIYSFIVGLAFNANPLQYFKLSATIVNDKFLPMKCLHFAKDATCKSNTKTYTHTQTTTHFCIYE